MAAVMRIVESMQVISGQELRLEVVTGVEVVSGSFDNNGKVLPTT